METCRLCLINPGFIDIFQANTNLSEKIATCTLVKVVEDDGFPQKICATCDAVLDVCCKFKRTCERSDKKLRIGLIKEDTTSEADDTKNNFVDEKRGLYYCGKCSKQFLNKHSLALHEGKKHGVRIHTCELCSLSYVSKYSLSLHKSRKHNIKQESRKKSLHQCHVCGKIINYEAELARHLLSHSGIKQFKCNQCDKAFSTKSSLLKHLMKHDGIKKFECYYCPKSFTHQNNLQMHLKVHMNERKYACNICHKRFKANRTLQLHYKIHANERDFPCNECEKAFVNKYDLMRHQKLHEKKRLIEKGIYDSTQDELDKLKNIRQCEHCGKICARGSDLTKHLRVHTGERPYPCSYCQKRFKSTNTLQCHERTHTQSRPFVCKYCGCGFTQSSILNTHERLHSGLRPFSCSFCSRTFNRKRDLQNHLRKHELNCDKNETENLDSQIELVFLDK